MPGFDGPEWTGRAQSLLFGVTRVCLTANWQTTDEYLFYPDDLPTEGLRRLTDAFATFTQPIADGRELRSEPGVRAHLVPLSAFLKVFYRLAYHEQALVIGFNLPFDLARLAYDWSPVKTERYAGGWSLKLWRYQEKMTGKYKHHPFRPRILIKSLDGKKAFVGFSGVKLGPEQDAPRSRFAGNFLDLRTLAFALTAKTYSLKKACEDFIGIALDKDVEHGIITSEYVAYARNDVMATKALAQKLLEEYDRHPISANAGGILSETKAFSPASIAKAYLRQMGITPHSCPPEIAGYAAAAYFGGWTETQIRLVRVPSVLLDFTSMYSTVNVLMGLWRFLTAEQVEFVDATEEIRALLDGLTADEVFDPSFWPKLAALVCIQPDGDVLAVRARFEPDRWSIGMVPYETRPSWYMLPDVVASVIKTGKVPHVLRALRMAPSGMQDDLKPIKLYGHVEIDPYRDDLFKKNIEERILVKRGVGKYTSLPQDVRDQLSLALKTFGNAGSYGINAEMNRRELLGGRKERVTLYSAGAPLNVELPHPEEPGPFTFLPIGALIPAAARLMLELAHYEVRRRGGIVVFGDTDSLAPAATRDGSLLTIDGRGADGQPIEQEIMALSWADVRAVVQRFEQLNPYDRDKVPGSILEIKEQNFDATMEQVEVVALAVSAKRYALFRQDGELVDRKESVLGMLLSPIEQAPEDDTTEACKDWISEAWSQVIPALVDGQKPNVPWLDVPAVRRLSVSSPTIMRQVGALNVQEGRRLPKQAQVKPFNFFLVTTGQRLRADSVTHDGPIETIPLIAPFERDPSRWFDHQWSRSDIGEPVSLSRDWYVFSDDGMPDLGIVPVTVGDFLADYAHHPEGDWLGPDGKLCTKQTRGVLQRRPVRKLSEAILGKEGDVLTREREDVTTAFGTEDVECFAVSGDPWLDVVLPALRLFPVAEVASACHVDERTVKRWRAGNVRPEHEALVTQRLARMAGEFLKAIGEPEGNAGRESCTILIRFVEVHGYIRRVLGVVVEEITARIGVRSLARAIGVPFETVRRWRKDGPPEHLERLLTMHAALAGYV